jgi:hypothetical protein
VSNTPEQWEGAVCFPGFRRAQCTPELPYRQYSVSWRLPDEETSRKRVFATRSYKQCFRTAKLDPTRS